MMICAIVKNHNLTYKDKHDKQIPVKYNETKYLENIDELKEQIRSTKGFYNIDFEYNTEGYIVTVVITNN